MNNRKKNINEINENGTEKRKKRGNGSLTDTRKIHLGPGTPLAEHCGAEVLRLDVATPAEAVRAIMLEHPGARAIIEAGQWMIRDGDHLAGGDWDLVAQRGRSDIYILPAGEGAGDGIGKIFAGIALAIFGILSGGTSFAAFPTIALSTAGYVGLGAALALSGLSRVLSPTPDANPMDLEAAGNRQSSIFSQPSTLSRPGQPVPIVYGTARVGGLRVSGYSQNRFEMTEDAVIYNETFGRIQEVISEAPVSAIPAGREGVFLNGSPIAPVEAITYTLAPTGAAGAVVAPSYRQIGVGVTVSNGSPVDIPISGGSVDGAVVTLHWPQLFTGSAVAAPVARGLSFGVEVSSAGGGFVEANAAKAPTIRYSADPPMAGFGEYLFRVTAPAVPSIADAAIGVRVSLTNPLFRVEFRLTVIWDSGGAAFQYPGGPQDFDVHFQATENLSVLPSPGPVLSRRVTVKKIEDFSATQIVGQSDLIAIDQDDVGYPVEGMFDIRVWADAVTPAERPEEMVIFTLDSATDLNTYGMFTSWMENGAVWGLALSGYSVDIEVLNLPLYGPAPYVVRVSRATADLAAGSLSRDEFSVTSVQEVVTSTVTYEESVLTVIEGVSDRFSPGLPNSEYILEGLKISLPTGYDPVAGTFTSPWNGTFQATKLYSNDPAWILWDLLVSDRFGLSIDPARIDKWSFGVASRRNLTLAPDLVTDGVTERRYTWNGSISTSADGFKVASQIAASMDAQIWISTQGLIFLGQDAPQTEISRLITQANVIGGLFTYEGTSVDARRNVSTATYRDRLAEYQPATVRADRQFSIDRYGETAIETDLPGVTSTGQAIRAARRILITDETENQTVRFQIGLENSGMQPGDLIEIADASRSQVQNGSRISSTFAVGGTLYLGVPGPTDWATIGTPGVSRVRWITTSGVVGDGNLALVWTPTLLVVNGTADWALPITEGAPVMISTATPETWRVLEIVDDGDGLYTVLAVQHDADKWAAIDDPTDLGTAYTFPGDAWPPPGFPS